MDLGLSLQLGNNAPLFGPSITYGPELITNPGFDADTDWTKSGEFSIQTGKAICTPSIANSSVNQEIIIQPLLQPGKTYAWSVQVDAVAGGEGYVQFSGNPQILGTWSSSGAYSGQAELLIGTNFRIAFVSGPGVSQTIDNVSCKEITSIPANPDVGYVTSSVGVNAPNDERTWDGDKTQTGSATSSIIAANGTGYITYTYNQQMLYDKITCWGTNYGNYGGPFTLHGSNTGAFSGEEVLLLDEQTGMVIWVEKSFNFTNSTKYQYYRLTNTNVAAWSLVEMELGNQ